MISRLVSTETVPDDNREDIKQEFLVLRIVVIIWSFSVVVVGVSQSSVIDKAFLLVSDFLMIASYITGVELLASITDRMISKKRTSYSISSELLYLGILVMIVRLVLGKSETSMGPFGLYFTMNLNMAFIIRVVFFISILFFYGAYTYMHYYMSTTKRQKYISRQCAIIVGIATTALIIETLGYIYLHTFVPSMYVGMLVILFRFKSLIQYKRSIEYIAEDYNNILSPSNEKPAFLCDDEGRILFENTRAFVMRQTYKDNYVGRLLTDIFVISDYDKERLREPRNTQKFEVYCKYPKEEREMLLTAKHNLDKFSDIISTEIEVGYAISFEDDESVVAARTDGDITDAKKNVLGHELSYEIINDIRTNELIKAIANQKKFYENGDRNLFELNLKAIEKASTILSIPALEDLCDRIQTELIYGEWEAIEPLMIDLDRQYETLVFINY